MFGQPWVTRLRKQGELERAELPASMKRSVLRRDRPVDPNPIQIAKLLIRIGRTKRRRKQFGEAAALFEEAFALSAGNPISEFTPAAFARQIGRTHIRWTGTRTPRWSWYRESPRAV